MRGVASPLPHAITNASDKFTVNLSYANFLADWLPNSVLENLSVTRLTARYGTRSFITVETRSLHVIAS